MPALGTFESRAGYTRDTGVRAFHDSSMLTHPIDTPYVVSKATGLYLHPTTSSFVKYLNIIIIVSLTPFISFE